MARPLAVGIDLGTTYSAVAWIHHDGHTAMVPNVDGEILTPSVILFDNREVIVGKEARKLALVQTDRVAELVKRDMGNKVYSRPIRGEYFPPEVLQAYILRKLKQGIERAVGSDYQVVITVPAFFDEPRRRATVQAGEMSDLDVLDIVNEPTAAALAFGEALGYLAPGELTREPLTVLVFDLGGGTFDVTLVRIEPGKIETLATDGDVRLGGRDWDMRLVDHVAQEFINQHREDPRTNPASMQRLLMAVEEAKHSLSARTHAKIHVSHAGSSATIEVTRDQFESLTSDLLERTVATTRQVLAEAGLAWRDIDRVLLVGGSTRMPMVRRRLEELSGKPPESSVHPDEAVARGAAIYANYLIETRADSRSPSFKLQVTNVNSHSLGVEGVDPETQTKRNAVIIPRNTQLPARTTREFATRHYGQRSIVVQVLEGESLSPRECSAIGRTVIRDLPANLPKGSPIEITFEYGTNGRLNVKAAVIATGDQATLELERDLAMPDNRVRSWKRTMARGEAVARRLAEGDTEGTQAEAGFESLLDGIMDELKLDAVPANPPRSLADSDNTGLLRSTDAQLPPEAMPAPARPLPILTTPTPGANAAAAATANRAAAPVAGQPVAMPAYQAPQPVAYGAAPSHGTTSPWQHPVMAENVGVPAFDAQLIERRPMRSLTRPFIYLCNLMLALYLHILAALSGLFLGYYVLCCLQPERFNRFDLPIPEFAVKIRESLLGKPADAPDTAPGKPAKP